MIKESEFKSVSWSEIVRVKKNKLNEDEIEYRQPAQKASKRIVAGVYSTIAESLGESLLNNQGKISPMLFSVFMTQCDEKLNEHADRNIERISRKRPINR